MPAPKAKPWKTEKAKRIYEGVNLGAARVLDKMVKGTHPDAHAEKATNQLRAAMLMAQGHFGMERAKTQSDAPRALGVIVVHRRLEDTPQNRLSWEEEAARLNDGRAIEAVAVPVKKEPDASS